MWRISNLNKSKQKERDADRLAQVEDNKDGKFDVLVRAKSYPKNSTKSSSTHVKADDVPDFHRQLKDVIQQSTTFSGVKRFNKEQQKLKEEQDTDVNMKTNLNRKERRKVIRKKRKKMLKQQKKREQQNEGQE